MAWHAVFISHVSRDRAWVYVETAFTSGWARQEDVALADEPFRKEYRTRVMAAVREDETPLVGAGKYLGQAHIGAIFPLHSHMGQDLVVRVPLRDADGRARTGLAQLGPQQAAPMPLPLTSRTLAGLADAMAGQLYGWGGLYENRDCSSTLRDLFLPFGVWLPRNSSQQARQGERQISLEGLNAEQKLSTIRSQGKPFLSLISMPGHIGLYLGTDPRGEPLLLHNIWRAVRSAGGGTGGPSSAGRPRPSARGGQAGFAGGTPSGPHSGGHPRSRSHAGNALACDSVRRRSSATCAGTGRLAFLKQAGRPARDAEHGAPLPHCEKKNFGSPFAEKQAGVVTRNHIENHQRGRLLRASRFSTGRWP